MTRRSLVALLLVLAIGPDVRAADPQPITVLAASSLTESLQAAGSAWSAKGHPAVSFSFDASSRLAKQIESGSPADAFFSADEDWMNELATKGLIDASTRADLVGNALVVAVPAGNPLAIHAATDLSGVGVKHLALAGESVPAGKYGRAALTTLHVWDAVNERVVNGDNVRAVLAWVASGEAEAGIVYATDAKVEPKVTVAFTFPPTSHPAIVYPAAVLKNAPHAADAKSFVAFCQSSEGLAIFEKAGFTKLAH
jgi:molybdate transport system substrate-binding protein